ncbi:unnamed protein product [Dibothriocephalus latus]|uniref:Uncharacterized protein n=1 Tax=Dibothriocephalus latus TaxID=60516 RepID=A0A3P7M2M7_DIBLA|nr:unnamed protein product [Dibothriocephalus latus]
MTKRPQSEIRSPLHPEVGDPPAEATAVALDPSQRAPELVVVIDHKVPPPRLPYLDRINILLATFLPM